MKNSKNKLLLFVAGILMAVGAVTFTYEQANAQVLIPCEGGYSFNREILDCEGSGTSCRKCEPQPIGVIAN